MLKFWMSLILAIWFYIMLIKGAWLAIFLVDFTPLYMADEDFNDLDYTRNPTISIIYSFASVMSFLSVANLSPKLFLACY